MNFGILRHLWVGIAVSTLAACGGGGGGDGGGGDDDGGPITPPPGFSSALNFTHPSNFLNGSAHVTQGTSTAIRGEVNSTFTPGGACPDGPLPQDFSVRWRSSASGASGTAPIGFGCVSFGGVPGITSFFEIASVALELGNNEVVLDTYDGSTQIGRDRILIVREDRVAPTVSITYPANGQQEVPLNHAVLIIFSEPMAVSSLTADRFRLEDASGAALSGQLTYDAEDRAWLFRPDAPLAETSTFEVSVSGDVEDAGGGNALGEDVTWGFTTGATTDITPLAFARPWPGGHCDCAPVSTRILAGMSEFIDPLSIGSDDIVVTNAGAPVSGTSIYRGDHLEFVPDDSLVAGATYDVTISSGLRDLAGQPIAPGSGWQFTTDARAPAGFWTETSQDQPPPAMSGATAVWSGTEVLVWGSSGAGRYDPAANAWSNQGSITVGGPSARFGHSATWTGTEMLIWGGRTTMLPDAEILVGGGAYDPVTDAWTEIVAPPAATSFPTYDHAAVWTGTELITWGGKAGVNGPSVNSGWRYDPATGTAVAFTGSDAPTPRSRARAIWTGSEMIVWGGFDADGVPLADGARYNPVADAWTPLAPVADSFAPGLSFSAVWTGSEMIVWNGGKTEADQAINDRFREPTLHLYDPLTDSWRTSASGWEPFLAFVAPILSGFTDTSYAAFWTGDRMFVTNQAVGPGYLYDPVLDSWQAVSHVLGLQRRGAAQVWAGTRFFHWGGINNVLPLDDGLLFEP